MSGAPVTSSRSWVWKPGWLLALAHGGLCAAVFSVTAAWPLAFVVPVPLAMLALSAPSMRSVVLPVIASQMLAWLWLLRWIIPVTAAGYPFLGLYQTLHTLLLVWMLRRVAGSQGWAWAPMALLLPTLWTASEYFRGEIAFNGYPWYLVGHPLINWLSFVQSSDLFGTYFVSFLVCIPAGVGLDIARVGRAPHRTLRAGRWSAIAGAAALAANVGYGQWRLHDGGSLAQGPRILAIQTNLPQDNKVGWTLERQAEDVPEFMNLTRRALADAGRPVDLIVWPETMVPSLGFDPQTRRDVAEFGPEFAHLTRWVDEVEALSRALGAPMLVGSEAWIGTNIVREDGRVRLTREREYNSAFLIQDDPPYERYDKAVLTPFGETMPYISHWPWLERQFLALGAQGMQFNLDANPDVRVLTLEYSRADWPTARTCVLGTPICFEDTVAWLCREMVYQGGRKRADAFVNISNDGWFNASVADRRYHAHIARFRCIENRLPMVRCVNTGMSVHIDSCGRVLAAAGGSGIGVANTTGWLLADLNLDARETLFGRIGGMLPTVCLLAAGALVASTMVRHRDAADAPRPHTEGVRA